MNSPTNQEIKTMLLARPVLVKVVQEIIFSVIKQHSVLVTEYLFGEKMFKYAIVVFTNFDVWKDRFRDDHDQDPDVDQYLKSLPDQAMNLLGKCKYRYVVFDNKCKGDEMDGQLRNLIEKIKNLITFNKDEVYTEERQGNNWKFFAKVCAGILTVGFALSKFAK
ncbi:unnamed protein product [Mytilus coruscus]|uniref:AIG1-type G domain-containing protein n=1 Tax=Mytilus coruscus TaxID=42192 RepID=A0A6J8A891_MYTCO|nr:unnamed protein product [Mytilus coruscus]